MANYVKTLAIVGGGAAGLAAAVRAGECARERGYALEIVVYESDERVGRSILATGNGRCNFSNSHIDVREYYNAEFVGDAFDALGATSGYSPVHAFFAGLGLAWREETDGRQYPLANKASVVVDVLRAAAAELGVREECNMHVSMIDPPHEPGKPFTLQMRDGLFQRADAVIVACGGRAVAALEAHDMERLRTRPVLGPIKVAPDDIPFARELDNIRVKCAVTLARKQGVVYSRIMTESGELMFRKYGVSGICVFNLSRFAWPGDVLRIDFQQVGGAAQAEDLLMERRRALAPIYSGELTYEQLLRGLLLPRVSEAILKGAEIDPASEFKPFEAGPLARLLTAYPLEVAGIADPDISQVRRGGFAVETFDPATMAARKIDGFYAAGEALDVDGPCGGYNLHWAWASGLLAARSAVEWLARR
ncbi:MAG: aminoacetone oxidase family FAD-binding enzyme [Eggerthellaceae bacterium]|nr:aminoacetone oxidase family FAD-binding enzyme [Eggerthellaceae bacterium]